LVTCAVLLLERDASPRGRTPADLDDYDINRCQRVHVIPVVATGINLHMTVVGRFGALRYSPTLRFIVIGAIAYTAVSLQGSFTALREVNRITHFTHWPSRTRMWAATHL
jgi:hypothetical protein